jgi:hypothetical protein
VGKCPDKALCAILPKGKNGQNRAFGLLFDKSYGDGVLDATISLY